MGTQILSFLTFGSSCTWTLVLSHHLCWQMDMSFHQLLWKGSWPIWVHCWWNPEVLWPACGAVLDLLVLRELHQFIKDYLNQQHSSHEGMHYVWNCLNYHRLSLYISIYLPIYIQVMYSYALLHIYVYTCAQAGIHLIAICLYASLTLSLFAVSDHTLIPEKWW